jgi:hypothetical protein
MGLTIIFVKWVFLIKKSYFWVPFAANYEMLGGFLQVYMFYQKVLNSGFEWLNFLDYGCIICFDDLLD